MGKLDEAMPWLEKALAAPRYEARCYPYMNLGRIYEQKHDWNNALTCYRRALQENSDYVVAQIALRDLLARLN